MEIIKTAIVGMGVSAKTFHLPFLLLMPEYKIVSVLERHGNTANQLLPQAQVVRTMEELLNTNIDLVIITTPNETHFSYAQQSLLAGKHVVVEKPFTITLEEAKELTQLAEKQNKIITVFHNRRYDSDFLTISQLLQTGWLGTIYEYEAHFDRYRPQPKAHAWREEDKPGSGILYDLGSHLIDQALCLFGSPHYISADIQRQRPSTKTDDYFEVCLYYEPTKVILKASMLVREPGPRFIIHGDKGSFIKNGQDPQEASLKAGKAPNSLHWGKEPDEMYGLLHTEMEGKIVRKPYTSCKGNYGLFYKNLQEAIEQTKEPPVTAMQACHVIQLIELSYKSNQVKCRLPCHL